MNIDKVITAKKLGNVIKVENNPPIKYKLTKWISPFTIPNSLSEGNQTNAVSIQGSQVNTINLVQGDVLVWNGIGWVGRC